LYADEVEEMFLERGLFERFCVILGHSALQVLGGAHVWFSCVT